MTARNLTLQMDLIFPTPVHRRMPSRSVDSFVCRWFAPTWLCLCLVMPLRADQEKYLPPGRPDAIALLAPPPLPGSAEQAADMAEVVAVHQACPTNEAAAALSQRKFSLFTFTPAIGSFFQSGRFPKTEAFFQRVQTEAAAATSVAKNHWKRPRPYVLDPTLAAGKLETSFSYPSGHSTEGMVLALLLAEVFPDRQDQILAVGREIGWHRVEIARHYPTDIYAGRTLAQAIVREFKMNPAFQHDFAEIKSELAAVRHDDVAPVNAVRQPAESR
jgi:acid phosphatase (class A)